MPRRAPRIRIKERHFLVPATGEQITVHEEETPKPGRKPKGRFDFTMVWFDEMLALPQIPWTAFRTLGALVRFHNQNTGTIKYSLEELAEITGEALTQNVSRSIGILVDAGYIFRVRRSEVMLNPNLLWVGNDASQEAAKERLMRMRENQDDA